MFGFVFLGGSVTGAQVHEVRLANELHRRGFPVHAWWAVDKPDHSPLAAGIPERWLFHSFRYATGGGASTLDLIGKLTNSLMNERWRAAFSQRIPWMVAGTLRGMIKMVCDGVTADQRLIRRFARKLTAAQVIHTLQTIELLAPFVEASRAHMPHPLEYMVQFQGYETYAPYASKLGLEQTMYQRLREVTEASGSPRSLSTIGMPLEFTTKSAYRWRICTQPCPGVPLDSAMDPDAAKTLVQQHFPDYDPRLPLIAYLGRRDSEKGIDLLLYAAKILRERGVQFQLAICGPTAFGSRYSVVCKQIAQVMQLPVLSSDYLSTQELVVVLITSYCTPNRMMYA